jgi:hypothetical protein
MTRGAWIAVGGVSALALGLLVALVVAVAGAGSDDEPETPEPTLITPGGAPSAELQECMAENGVERPEPGVPQQAPPAGLEEALEACSHLLPEGAAPGEGGGLRIMPPSG